MRRIVWMLGGFVAVVALIVLFWLGLLYVMQDRMLFIPTRDHDETPADMGWPHENVRIAVDGETTHGWYIPAEGASRGVVLFSHGNAGNIGGRLLSVSTFRDLGFDTLVYDYGGYGESTGKVGERRCYEDIRAMWRHLSDEREIAPERIVLFGRSLGAAVTCQLATEVEAGAVILESAFLSVPAMAREVYSIFPFDFLIKHRFDNAAKVGELKSPVLFVHSPDDEIIPFRHGKALFELAPEPKTFLDIQGGHNDGFWTSGDAYTDGLNDFLSPLLEGDRPRPSSAHGDGPA